MQFKDFKSILLFLFVFICLCDFGLSLLVPLIKKPYPHIFPSSGRRSPGEAIPLGGGVATYGEFFVNISVGTPSKKFLVVVDTGSTDLLLFGTSCSGCADSNAFEPTPSTHIQPCNGALPCRPCINFNSTSVCGFEDFYGSGADVFGIVVSDIFSVGDFSPSRVYFGDIQSVSGNFVHNADGIWGLAYSPLSSWERDSAIETLIIENNLLDIFSLCLVDINPIMSIGLNLYSIIGIQWTSILFKAWYTVSVVDIQINGVSLGFLETAYSSTGPSIVDSGTTYLLLPEFPYIGFIYALQNLCISVNLVGICGVPFIHSLFDNYCYSMSPEDVDNFPTITIILGEGVVLEVPKEQYLFKIVFGTESFYCLGVSQSPNGIGVILGDIVMRGYHVIFDRANSRIGFAPLSSCPTIPETTTMATTAMVTTAMVTTAIQTTGSSRPQCISDILSGSLLPSPLNQYITTDFNLISFNNFVAASGEIEGRLAVRNNATIGNGFSIGSALITSGSNPPDKVVPFSLVVGLNLDWQGGGLYPDGAGSGLAEGIFVGGEMTGASYLFSRRTGGPCASPGCLDPAFNSMYLFYSTLSTSLSDQIPNAGYQFINNGIVLYSSEVSLKYYVHIAASDINMATSFSAGSLNPNAEFFITIIGGDVQFSGGSFNGHAGLTVYIILGEKEITVSGTTVVGSILAPDSILNNLSGDIDGFVIVHDVISLLEVKKPTCPPS